MKNLCKFFCSDYVFGQDLSFVFSPPKYQIPVFLKLCTSVIEERLQPTDLNIYVSSARCTRLQELCSNHGLDIFYDEKNPMKRPSPPVTLPEELGSLVYFSHLQKVNVWLFNWYQQCTVSWVCCTKLF